MVSYLYALYVTFYLGNGQLGPYWPSTISLHNYLSVLIKYVDY